MKTTIIITLAIATSFIGLAQQPQQKPTLTKKEQVTQAAVKEYNIRVQNEHNQTATDMLKTLKDTSLSLSERKTYIDIYRTSVRNGNPSLKKKSYDLTTDEILAEYMALSKSPKFNKKTQQTCLVMRKDILDEIETQKRYKLNPLADEWSDDFIALQDTSHYMNYGNRLEHIESYVVFKCNEQPAPRDKRLAMLLEMSTSQKFDNKVQAHCLEMYNKSK